MLAITGANGHLGQRLLRRLAPDGPVRALVRSARAAAQVRGLGLGDAVEVRIVDYADADALADHFSAVIGRIGLPALLGLPPRRACPRWHSEYCSANRTSAHGLSDSLH